MRNDIVLMSSKRVIKDQVCVDALRDILKAKLKNHDKTPLDRVHRGEKPYEFQTIPLI